MDEFKKVYFNLNKDLLFGYETESLWVKPLSNNCYQIKNTPFFVKGVSFEDIVYIKNINNKLFYDYTCLESGHSTYRIILLKNINKNEFTKYWKALNVLGCSFESMKIGNIELLAIDIPPKVDMLYAYELLEKGEKFGIWDFEEGHYGHKVIKDST